MKDLIADQRVSCARLKSGTNGANTPRSDNGVFPGNRRLRVVVRIKGPGVMPFSPKEPFTNTRAPSFQRRTVTCTSSRNTEASSRAMPEKGPDVGGISSSQWLKTNHVAFRVHGHSVHRKLECWRGWSGRSANEGLISQSADLPSNRSEGLGSWIRLWNSNSASCEKHQLAETRCVTGKHVWSIVKRRRLPRFLTGVTLPDIRRQMRFEIRFAAAISTAST
jgi:hypothetical protein